MADSWRARIGEWWKGTTAQERGEVSPEITAINQEIARVREEIEHITYTARERAWVVEQTGVVLGEGKDRLYTDPMGFEAPKYHPVWADELRYELAQLRKMGEAGTVKKREYEVDYVKWPRADVLERFGERVGEDAAPKEPTLLDEFRTFQRQWEHTKALEQKAIDAYKRTQEPEKEKGRDYGRH